MSYAWNLFAERTAMMFDAEQSWTPIGVAVPRSRELQSNLLLYGADDLPMLEIAGNLRDRLAARSGPLMFGQPGVYFHDLRCPEIRFGDNGLWLQITAVNGARAEEVARLIANSHSISFIAETRASARKGTAESLILLKSRLPANRRSRVHLVLLAGDAAGREATESVRVEMGQLFGGPFASTTLLRGADDPRLPELVSGVTAHLVREANPARA